MAKTTGTTVVEAVHRALPNTEGQWATTHAVAAATGMGYSTVTGHLRNLATTGRAESTKDGRSTVWRQLGPVAALDRDDVPRRKARPFRKPPRPPVAAAVAVANEPAETEPVVWFWVAVKRRGINHHYSAVDSTNRTACGRPTHSGLWLDFPPAESPLCPDCGRTIGAAPAERPVAVPEPAAVPVAPTVPGSPASGGVAAVAAFMVEARPVSAPPAEPARATRRTRRDPDAAPHVYAVWARGALQEAILDHIRGLVEGTDATPHQVAKALNSHSGAVAYGLDRLRIKGSVVKTSDRPMRYAAG